MGILDDAKALQSRKRTDRLLLPKQKKIKGATYKGKDPVDGTDIVEVDGDESVSGFRLISNKSISIGDRVSLRPSKSGLQRADAKNVKPNAEVIPVVDNTDIQYICVWGNGLSVVAGLDRTLSLGVSVVGIYSNITKIVAVVSSTNASESVQIIPNSITVLGHSQKIAKQTADVDIILSSNFSPTIIRRSSSLSISIPIKSSLAKKIKSKIGGVLPLTLALTDPKCPVSYQSSINNISIDPVDDSVLILISGDNLLLSIPRAVDGGDAISGTSFNFLTKWEFRL